MRSAGFVEICADLDEEPRGVGREVSREQEACTPLADGDLGALERERYLKMESNQHSEHVHIHMFFFVYACIHMFMYIS